MKFRPESGSRLSRQLSSALKLEIIHGKFKPGDVLPTITELSAQCQTSFKVARRALEILASEGWTRSCRGVGPVVLDRDDAAASYGRVLIYVRQTGYSYYASAVQSAIDSRLMSCGYKTFVVSATGRSEAPACRRLESLLLEKWSLAVLFGDSSDALRLVRESGRPFLLLGDGAPLPKCADPACVGRGGFRIGKAVPDFVRECVRCGIRSVVQFKYQRGSFDATGPLVGVGIATQTVKVARKATPEAVAMAAMETMGGIIAAGRLPDLFLFTDDYLAQGALIALSAAGMRVPEDVSVATHANKGCGPIWPRPLARFEVDPVANGRAAADTILAFLRTGKPQPPLELGSVWKKGETMRPASFAPLLPKIDNNA